jgi:hypothetical protein
MTIPNFTVAYRAPGVVDLLIPKQVGVDGYRINASLQFDGSPAFVTLFTVTNGAGYLDPAVDRGKLHTMPGTNRVRAVFNPATYGAGQTIDAGLLDTAQFWLTLQPVVGGVAGTASAPALVLSTAQLRGTERVVIAGSAPMAADPSGSLALFLGRRMGGFSFANTDSTNPLFVGYGVGGPEMQVGAGTSRASAFGTGSTSALVVRGTGGAVPFTADFAVA